MKRLQRSARWLLAAAITAAVAFAAWRYHERILPPEQVIGPAPRSAITAAYFREVSVEAVRVPFREVIERLAGQVEAPIEVRWEQLSPNAGDYPLTLLLDDVPLHEALAFAVHQVQVPSPPVVVAEAGRVVITSPWRAAADVTDHRYSLRPFVDLLHVQHMVEHAAMWNPDPLPTRLDTCHEIAEVFADLVRDHDWRETGELAFDITVHEDETATVTTERLFHARFYELLYDLWLSEVHGVERHHEFPRRQRALETLAQVDLRQLHDTAAEDVYTNLRRASGLSMSPGPVDLGHGYKLDVGMHGGLNVPPLDALRRAVIASEPSGMRIGEIVNLGVTAEGVMWTSDVNGCPQRITRVYHIGDLAEEWLPAPRMRGLDPPHVLLDLADPLQKLIVRVIDTDDWREYGGLTSTMTMFHTGRTMIVTAPLEVHDEVDRLLARHRRLRDRAKLLD